MAVFFNWDIKSSKSCLEFINDSTSLSISILPIYFNTKSGMPVLRKYSKPPLVIASERFFKYSAYFGSLWIWEC